MTRILAAEPAAIAEAATILKRGGLVSFPTETVYGLGARGLHKDEVAKIFAAKGRPPGHPVILHVDGEEMARGLAAEWPPVASELARRFWPGPLTIVVPRAAHVPPEVSGGLDTVGIRAPAHPVALALIRAVGEPLAAPSANIHTMVSPTKAGDVASAAWKEPVELVLDGGPCEIGIESTVVAVGSGPLRILRPGAVTLEQLRAVDPDAVDGTTVIEGDEARAAPGMASRHYAPSAHETRLLPYGDAAAFPDLAIEGGRKSRSGKYSVAAIVLSDAVRRAAEAQALQLRTMIVMPADPALYARGLYAALRDADKHASHLILVESPPDTPAWTAVLDRLRRATHR